MKKLVIGILILLNVLSIEFFYSVDQRSKNLGFCGTVIKESEEPDKIFELLAYSDHISNIKILKNHDKDFLKEILNDIPDFKNIAFTIQIPQVGTQTAFISESRTIIPEFLLKERLFKPPKISC